MHTYTQKGFLQPTLNGFLFLHSSSIGLDHFPVPQDCETVTGRSTPGCIPILCQIIFLRCLRGHLGSKWKGESSPPAVLLKTRNCLSVIGMGHKYTKLARVKPAFIWLPKVQAYQKPFMKENRNASLPFLAKTYARNERFKFFLFIFFFLELCRTTLGSIE